MFHVGLIFNWSNCLQLFQRVLWGLERSPEDHVSPVGGPLLRQLDWLWQSLGWPEERLDQPRDQQVRPGSVLTAGSTLWRHPQICAAPCCPLRSTEAFSTQPLSHPEFRREAALHWPIALLSRGQLPLMRCWHTATWKRGRDDEAALFDECKI